MQQLFEEIVANDRFNMRTLLAGVEPILNVDQDIAEALTKLKVALGENDYQRLIQSIIRQVFFIELVKVPKIESTKMRVRWYEQLRDDPRYCSYDESLEIARDLIKHVAEEWLSSESRSEELKLFFEHALLPYELPIDYSQVVTGNPIHQKGNLVWVDDPLIARTLKLRAYLTDESQHQHAVLFKKALDDKIKIKAYLTDRALTGVNKTNREKRWETHPAGVQFATRFTCLKIEYTLLVQLCSFEGFPSDVREALQRQGVLPSEIQLYRCPIIMEPMSFEKFKEELLNPQHGRSSFQVGHLNPLKLNSTDRSESAGHTEDNIGWVSADGNRIQGHLSLADTRALLRRISRNYEELSPV
jgi:hypothetical protein